MANVSLVHECAKGQLHHTMVQLEAGIGGVAMVEEGVIAADVLWGTSTRTMGIRGGFFAYMAGTMAR